MDTQQRHDTAVAPSVFASLQAVYGRDMGVWGHGLTLLASSAHHEGALDPGRITGSVLADGIGLALRTVGEQERVLVSLSERHLLEGAASLLPKERCAIAFSELLPPGKEVLAALFALKKQGHLLVLDDYCRREGRKKFALLADMARIDMAAMDKPGIIRMVQRSRAPGGGFMARNVSDEATYAMARALGFTAFQGGYFSRPHLVEGRSIPSATLTRFKLMRALADPDYEVGKVSAVISHDVGLAHKLLRYVAAVLRKKDVTSIPQAVTVMGSGPLKKWLMVAMMSDLEQGGRARELTRQSAHRARFLESLAPDGADAEYGADTLFMMGLFSNLDALLNQPMREIVAHLPLDAEIAAALCGVENRARAWLDLAEALDSGQWPRADEVMQAFSLDRAPVAARYAKAALWARAVTESGRAA